MQIWTRRTAAAICLLFLIGTGNSSEEAKVDLRVGDAAPSFEAIDDQGNAWYSADFVGKKYLVVYFYPADFTSGCRTQAQKFRDNMNQLTEKGIMVVGISGDGARNHELFKKAEKLNFTLLADEDGGVAKKFGVPLGKGGEVKTKDGAGNPITLTRGVTAARWTFVIGLDGKVAYKNTKVVPGEDSKQVASFLEMLQMK